MYKTNVKVPVTHTGILWLVFEHRELLVKVLQRCDLWSDNTIAGHRTFHSQDTTSKNFVFDKIKFINKEP